MLSPFTEKSMLHVITIRQGEALQDFSNSKRSRNAIRYMKTERICNVQSLYKHEC